MLVAMAVVLVVAMVVFGRFCSMAATVHVTVNGSPVAVHGEKNMEAAIRESGLPINPGDLISLKGAVLKRSAGYPFYATVNGEETADPKRALQEGDEIEVTDGKDMVEEYDATQEAYPHEADIKGMGALCTITAGADGIVEHRVGRLSGEEVDHVTDPGTPTSVVWHSPDTQGDKVIALTFEQGPSDKFTEQILDVLEENDAHATFFCVGEQALARPEIVQREWFGYHQVCSNTYDRKVNKDSDPSLLPDQIRRGRESVAEAVGDADMNRIVKLPEIPITSEVAVAIEDEVDVVVGWDLDTADWIEGNVDEVYDVLMSVKPGNVVYLRDGGGDRSATVNALRHALPELAKQGYSFITIGELLAYPAQ